MLIPPSSLASSLKFTLKITLSQELITQSQINENVDINFPLLFNRQLYNSGSTSITLIQKTNPITVILPINNIIPVTPEDPSDPSKEYET